MPQFTLPYFGSIDSGALENNYETEIRIAGYDISLDLNFSGKSIEPSSLSILNKYLDNLEDHLLKTREFISENYADEDAADGVRFYFEFHKEEAGIEELGINETGDADEQLLNKIHPVRIGLYPDSHQFAVYDYTFGKDFTNYVLVINTDEDGDLTYITVES
ncbi:DUF2004 domain-containing protein [Chitinophaga silvisoli]|uniref:DUF2004 domain-containing protein n=1 Tax=Chitinophaga silvisoli TaxID=2291814 RepID=A0A3E1P8I8_9BACT|nr:DUF2004 domain-containing protein [Chitinophaga silvisoli]RFM36509.1 DUF2004 domain-containing protein [Chitinophaga silvisoli]